MVCSRRVSMGIEKVGVMVPVGSLGVAVLFAIVACCFTVAVMEGVKIACRVCAAEVCISGAVC